jgi:L-amino acid N-acyltransferase YncA
MRQFSNRASGFPPDANSQSYAAGWSGNIWSMATTGTRPQLQIRPAREDDAASMCEIFNEAVQDKLDTFDSEPRRLDDQRLLIAAAERDPKHPILVAEVRNWIAGWVTLGPYDTRLALDDIGEVFIYVRRSFRNYGVGRQLMRAVQEAAGKLGYRKLIGRILVANRDGLLLCRATGWREVGRHLAHARLADGLQDVDLVEYLVPSSPVSQT